MTQDGERRPGISIKTLVIASAASATATLVVPLIWRPGTLAAAAVTPIIVALVTEALNRPKLPAQLVRQGRERVVRREDRFGLYAAERRKRLLRVGVITGLLAFLVVGAAWTAGELAAGESLSGGKRTTYFGGQAGDREAAEEERGPEATATPAAEKAAPEETPEAPVPTVTATPTITPEATATPTATATATPPQVAPEATATPTATP